VLTILFELDGHEYMGLNGGPAFKFNEAISFMVRCKTQEEIDHLWAKLSAHKDSERCGWLKDKFGVSWQIIPTIMEELMKEAQPKKTEAMMAAMMKMKKLDINALKHAYDQA